MENKELYIHVFEYVGQACICVSKPRSSGKIKVYDLDAGELFTLDTQEVKEARKCRLTEPEDFLYSTIIASRYADEAAEISYELFDY